MDERRNAARFQDMPALIAHPKDLIVRRPKVAPAARLRTSWRSVGVGIGLVIVVALSVALTVGFEHDQRIAVTSTTPSNLGSGYPPHYGLAGPSQLGPSFGSWRGYPPHYGLAGPSQLGPSFGSWRGYPPHYGLAGPSQLDDGS